MVYHAVTFGVLRNYISMAYFALFSSLRGSRAGIFDNVSSVQFHEPTRSGLNVVAVHVGEA